MSEETVNRRVLEVADEKSWRDPRYLHGERRAGCRIPGVVGGQRHPKELRTALTKAYHAAEQSAPTCTDATIIARQTGIKAGHISELRTFVD